MRSPRWSSVSQCWRRSVCCSSSSGLRSRKPERARLKKIVVLPFENLGAPEDAYFAAGMTEEITSRLANVQGLGVISRTSAVEYDRKGKTVKQIGSDLGVDYVLEGSVRWEHGQGKESRVRITPQLIRVADDTHVWADRYDRVLADVFAIQSEVAESAVRAMGVTLLPPEQTRLKEISTSDLEAYDLYLQGVELTNRGTNRRIRRRRVAEVPGGRRSRPPLRAGACIDRLDTSHDVLVAPTTTARSGSPRGRSWPNVPSSSAPTWRRPTARSPSTTTTVCSTTREPWTNWPRPRRSSPATARHFS